MSRLFAILFCVSFQLVHAATENVTTNVLYSPMYNSSVIVTSTIKSFVIVALLIAFWMYWNKVILPNLSGGMVQNRNMQLVEKLQLDPTTAVYLVKIGDTYESFVTSNRQISRLTNVAAKTINLKKTPTQPITFATLLKQVKKSKLTKK